MDDPASTWVSSDVRNSKIGMKPKQPSGEPRVVDGSSLAFGTIPAIKDTDVIRYVGVWYSVALWRKT